MRLYDPAYVRRIETLGASAPVQVCLESRMLRDVQGTGVATYARMLADCLPDVGATPLVLDDDALAGGRPRQRALRLLHAARPGPRTALASVGEHADLERWVVRDVFREAQVFFNLHGRLLPVAFAKTPQVMHWTYPVPLYVIGAKNLYTIHDLIPLTHPDLTPIPRDRHARMLAEIARHAHTLVTVSESIRALVIEQLGVAPKRVINTYQAVGAPLQADLPLPDDIRPGRYFLFCGRVERRKNLERVALAHRASGTTLPLLIVGPRTPGEERLEQTLCTFPNVRRLDWVPRQELIGLLRRARALLFPSLAEGFGLPIAEAMMLGCPVVASDRGAGAEIAGDAGLLVAPDDIGAITQAIAMLDRDARLRIRLRTDGFARARLFTRENYVNRLRALYAHALATSAPGPGCNA